MNKSYYEATEKARSIFYRELHFSKMYMRGYTIAIFGSTLLIAGVWIFFGFLAYIFGLAMFLLAYRRTANKRIY